jgi:glycosyltransferase involved in cell wall biosynthesis
MKIALVARHATPPTRIYDPYSADQAAHVSGLGRALAAQGHDVVIYARKDSEKLPSRLSIAPRLTAEFITAGPQAPVPPDQLPQYAREIASYLAARWRKNTPDVVHAYHWTSALAALSAAREVPVPIVATFGSLGAAERRHGIAGECSAVRLRLESCIAKTATSVLATTSDEINELSRLGVQNGTVAYVPTGVDTTIFKPTGYSAKRTKHPRLLTVGPLTEYRGLDLLLRCLPELPGAELVIAGGPPADELESDHGYRILAKLAAHLGITERVHFTGHVDDRELPSLLRSADLLVSAARYEPLGSIAIRAMACGLPVVATEIGSYRDAVIDGTSGLLVPAERPAALARQLHDLLATPMRMAAFGIAAADRARSRYSWDRVAAETAAVYERAISKGPSVQLTLAAVPAAGKPRQAGSLRAVTSRTTVRPVQHRTGSRQSSRNQPLLVPVGGHAA